MSTQSKNRILIEVIIGILAVVGIFLLARGGTPTVPTGTEGWKKFVSETNNVSFLYPESLGTTYISPEEWPPALFLGNQAFACEESDGEGPMGTTVMKLTVNGHDYCKTEYSEGAAGSIYTTNTYEFALGKGIATFAFTIRSTQCGNYDEPEKSDCEQERAVFNLDPIIDKMAQSIK